MLCRLGRFASARLTLQPGNRLCGGIPKELPTAFEMDPSGKLAPAKLAPCKHSSVLSFATLSISACMWYALGT